MFTSFSILNPVSRYMFVLSNLNITENIHFYLIPSAELELKAKKIIVLCFIIINITARKEL